MKNAGARCEDLGGAAWVEAIAPSHKKEACFLMSNTASKQHLCLCAERDTDRRVSLMF